MPAQKIIVRPENHSKSQICYFLNINQEQVYRTKISDVDELKRRINSEWAALTHTVIESDNVEWHQRLYALAFMLERSF